MGTILRISKKKSLSEVTKELDGLISKKRLSKKSIWDSYGALPDTFGDALEYQKRLRDEWR